jgi:hypothetical protein
MNDFSDFWEEEIIPRNILLEKYFRINNEYMPIIEQFEIEKNNIKKQITPNKQVSIFDGVEKETTIMKYQNFSLHAYLYRIITKKMTIVDIKKVNRN